MEGKRKKSAEIDTEFVTASPTGVGQCMARTAASAYLFILFFFPFLSKEGEGVGHIHWIRREPNYITNKRFQACRSDLPAFQSSPAIHLMALIQRPGSLLNCLVMEYLVGFFFFLNLKSNLFPTFLFVGCISFPADILVSWSFVNTSSG